MVYTLMFRAARQHLQRTTTTTTTQQWVVRQRPLTLWPRPPRIQAAVWALGAPTWVLGGSTWVLGGPTWVLGGRTFSLDSSLRNKSQSSVSRHQGGIQPSTARKGTVETSGSPFYIFWSHPRAPPPHSILVHTYTIFYLICILFILPYFIIIFCIIIIILLLLLLLYFKKM